MTASADESAAGARHAGPRAVSLRIVAAAAVVGSLIAVPAASADHSDQAVCSMFGDDGRQLVEQTDRRPSHDVRGGAIGSDDRQVTALIHLGALPSSPPDPRDALFAYTFFFRVGDDLLFMNVPADSSARPSYGVLLPAGRRLVLGEPQVVRDAKADQLRITAPLQGFGLLTSPRAGAAVTDLIAWGEVTNAAGPVPSTGPLLILDVAAEGDPVYRIGDRSCVRMGG